MAIASASGDWPGTEQACRELIAEDPFDGRAIFNLGRSLHGQGRLDEAAEQFRQSGNLPNTAWSRFIVWRALMPFSTAPTLPSTSCAP